MTVIDDISEPGAWARAIGRGCVPTACDYAPTPAAAEPDAIAADERQWLHDQDIEA